MACDTEITLLEIYLIDMLYGKWYYIKGYSLKHFSIIAKLWDNPKYPWNNTG